MDDDRHPHQSSSNREGDILLLQYNEAQEDNGHQHQEQEVLQQETGDDEKSFPELKEQQQHDEGESEEDEDGAKIASGGPQETMAPRVVDDALMSVEDETSSLPHSSFRDRRKIMTNTTGATVAALHPRSSTTATTTSSSDEVLFPMKLFHMLNDATDQGFDNIVSWGHDPNSFNVHKKTQFAEKVLPKYFKMTKYKSFTRQLHNYEFVWIRRGPDKGGSGVVVGNTKSNFPRHFEPRTIEEMLEDESGEDAIIVNPPQQVVGGSRTLIDLDKQMAKV